jgi:hypothetical protein
MYWTGINPATGRKIYVEKDPVQKQKQKDIATAGGKRPGKSNKLSGAGR